MLPKGVYWKQAVFIDIPYQYLYYFSKKEEVIKLPDDPSESHGNSERNGGMYSIALKMLIGDRGKYLGIIMGLTFASLIITQQSAIFTGLMTRTYGLITDLSQPDIWVMDPKV
jgi:hypothetical protein